MNTQINEVIDYDDFTATYSPEDNKLRLYAVDRLSEDLYKQSREAGFRWAPKQELFYAHWSPVAEDFILMLAGEVGDEDTSLADRAAQRAERFEGYQGSRLKDAQSAHDGAKAIADNIPFGQPILVGHHSEKRARKDAERIESGMRKAVSMWETAEYWENRAQGVIFSAEYKERPQVRARRIKKIEAETRKYQKGVDHAQLMLDLWAADDLNEERAIALLNCKDHMSMRFPLDRYPREAPASQYEGSMSLWSAVTGGVIGWEKAREIAKNSKPSSIKHYMRLINHNNNRLNYEKTMLEAQGGSDLLKPKARPKQLPLLNYRAPEGIRVDNSYHKGEYSIYEQVELTKAEYAAISKDYKGGQAVGGTHRVKVAINAFLPGKSGHGYSAVFLTDSKIHEKPEV